MKDDEKRLLDQLVEDSRQLTGFPTAFAVLDVRGWGRIFGVHPKRIEYLCEKWSRKGWYEWGVVHDLGWFTPEGIDALK